MPDAEPEAELMTVFAEALERRSPPDRAAYLDAACAGNVPLRERVEALLAAHLGAGRFLEGDSAGLSGTTFPVSKETTRASSSQINPRSETPTRGDDIDATATTSADRAEIHRSGQSVAGEVIAGRYTLIEVLGEGGMGTVYRARQTEPVKRDVALKLIKLGMDSRAVLARFNAERQALALMDHPNIAHVFDGGTTDSSAKSEIRNLKSEARNSKESDATAGVSESEATAAASDFGFRASSFSPGRPYFVMELVSGVPVNEYCDQKRLPVESRLELFVSVCQAVQHAHQKGIIHRDLKPGNVLVTEVDGRPTPKVIDFGVAKAIEFKLTEESLADTGAIVGTPAYMSPEQADPSSMDIDTRTDIYALGVILYELLAGSPPIDAKQFRRGAILEMLRMVREVDPPRPSTKVSTAEALPSIAASRGIEPEHLKRALRGDLDWIVMKALEKDRSRRYETANGFAADVLRHLANEPVLAAPPGRIYLLRKFARKHRGPLAAAGLVLLSLIAGIVGTAWQAAKRIWPGRLKANAPRVRRRRNGTPCEWANNFAWRVTNCGTACTRPGRN